MLNCISTVVLRNDSTSKIIKSNIDVQERGKVCLQDLMSKYRKACEETNAVPVFITILPLAMTEDVIINVTSESVCVVSIHGYLSDS
jgi:hypothetical protein